MKNDNARNVRLQSLRVKDLLGILAVRATGTSVGRNTARGEMKLFTTRMTIQPCLSFSMAIVNKIHLEISIQLTAGVNSITLYRTILTFPVHCPPGCRKGFWEYKEHEQKIYESTTDSDPKDRIDTLQRVINFVPRISIDI